MTKENKTIQVPIGDQLPRRGNVVSRAAATFLLFIAGWKVTGILPNVPKVVLVGAPHTSNWEGVITVVVSIAVGVRLSWMTKKAMFKPPFGGLMRWFGGLSIDRTASHGVVGQMVDAFNEKDKLALAIMPEGTRSKVKGWKSGFYHIAQGANIPVLPVAFDYGNKEVRFFPVYHVTDEYERDLAALQSLFVDVVPKNPKEL